jgi:1,4-dihydroxy-2-naphthoyl-CoA hydrolase
MFVFCLQRYKNKMIWSITPDIEAVNRVGKNTMVGHLEIEITEIGEDFIRASMPVNEKTMQPAGLLHGGATAALSESIGSIASWLVAGDENARIVGVELNISHLRSAQKGYVHSITRPVKIGKTLHVWNTEVFDDEQRMICTSRLTVYTGKQG